MSNTPTNTPPERLEILANGITDISCVAYTMDLSPVRERVSIHAYDRDSESGVEYTFYTPEDLRQMGEWMLRAAEWMEREQESGA